MKFFFSEKETIEFGFIKIKRSQFLRNFKVEGKPTAQLRRIKRISRNDTVFGYKQSKYEYSYGAIKNYLIF